ncbi:hypothetical protein ACIF70_15835 [Actinacidiphila glaucinigra]|uniref:hypothetical protein n=1 Tax=Actinacidiphila glaucinigra TaxID=235986 RepID=UPI0037CB296D
MTSTTGTDEHPEVAEISALTEGILPPERSADVRGHIDGCALCADVRASLDEIRGLLGTLPGPPRMPADIAGRIDAALAAEALLTASGGADVSRETEAAEPPRVSRETSAPAAGRPSGRGAGPSGPGRPGARSRRRWGKGILVAASAAAVVGLGSFLAQSTWDAGGSADRQSSAASGVGAKADADTLGVQVHDLLTRGTSDHAESKPSRQSPMVGMDSVTPSCVLEALDRQETPIAVQRGRYERMDSYLVVLPHKGDPALVDAYVVDASCTTAQPPATGTLLREETYPR